MHPKTQFSNNIRNNFGFLNCADPEGVGETDKLFVQEGRKVFKEVVPMVAGMIQSGDGPGLGIKSTELKRLWLHQANAGMNRLIAERVLGHEASEFESPTVLRYLCEHVVGGLDHRLPQTLGRFPRRRQGPDLFVRGREIRRERRSSRRWHSRTRNRKAR